MDVFKRLEVSLYPSGEKAIGLMFCFDNGSPFTFIKKSAAKSLGEPLRIPQPKLFHGLGGGSFQTAEIMLLHVKLLEFWCSQLAYVAEDNILEKGYDILAGHDFMQLYGVKLLPRKGDIEIDEVRLSLAQRIR